MNAIRTTHTGSLPRPPALLDLLAKHDAGGDAPGLGAAAADAVTQVVRRQVEAGIDLVNDGEQGKSSYATYVIDRLTGFEPGKGSAHQYRDEVTYPDLAELRGPRPPATPLPACTGPVASRGDEGVTTDIANLRAAAAAAGADPDRLFLSAASPGVIAAFMDNLYYPSAEDYLAAIVDAMRGEYRAIVEAGFILQLDCPDFAMRQGAEASVEVADIRTDVARSVEALNAALAGLPADRLRLHVCWGNNENPHTDDVALADVIDLVLRAAPAGIAVEAANPRHGHEWQLFEEVTLPDEKYILPGVIDTTTNFVEHPELVAQRIRNYARILGPERVVATTDCGFGTTAGRGIVAPSVVWAKMRSLAQGASLV